jgi:hypothetical protein
LELHDLSRDPQAGTKEAFKIRCQKNFENWYLHHHVLVKRYYWRCFCLVEWVY